MQALNDAAGFADDDSGAAEVLAGAVVDGAGGGGCAQAVNARARAARVVPIASRDFFTLPPKA